jgi:DNA-directed RNA polymerase specialized sigma24 family protein
VADDASNPDPTRLMELPPEQWREGLLRAFAYAREKSKYWNHLGFEFEAEELLQEAVARAFGAGRGRDGRPAGRNWNQDRYPNLAEFLIATVDSLISHAYEHHQRFSFSSFQEGDEERDLAGRLDVGAQAACELVRPKDPEALLEMSQRHEALRGLLDAVAEEDEEIGLVLLALEDGATKSELPGVTGFSAAQVYNITKRLRRKIREFYAKDADRSPEVERIIR